MLMPVLYALSFAYFNSNSCEYLFMSPCDDDDEFCTKAIITSRFSYCTISTGSGSDLDLSFLSIVFI